MPYIFIDDGYPESAEFDDNYVWIDAADPKSLAAVEQRRRVDPIVRPQPEKPGVDTRPRFHRWKFWR